MPPKLCIPSRKDLAPLLEYAKPLSVVILFRLLGTLDLLVEKPGPNRVVGVISCGDFLYFCKINMFFVL